MTAGVEHPAIAHQALVLLCDGARALIARNIGTAFDVRLQVVLSLSAPDNLPSRFHGSDRPGKVAVAGGTHRSAVEATDHHALAEAAFVAEAVEAFEHISEQEKSAALAVVAPPRALATLRRHMDHLRGSRPVVQIDKDLTKHPTKEIERILSLAERS